MTDYTTIRIPIKQTSSAYYARRRAAMQSPERHCQYCGAVIVRRYNEVSGRWECWSDFLKRNYCNASCSQRARNMQRMIEAKEEMARNYRWCSQLENLFVSKNGEFLYNGREKKVQYCTGHRGESLTARIIVKKDGHNMYFSAARLVASAWVRGYEDGDYIEYIDGNIHNIRSDNLRLVSKKEYDANKCKDASQGHKTNTYCYQVKRLENVIEEATAVLHYFKTEDLSLIHKHVESYLYDCLMDYSLNTLHLGTLVAQEQVCNALAHFYDVIINGHAVSHPEHYCKELLYRYKKNGSFGHMGDVPKKIKLIIHQLNTDCLWEKFKVTHFKK